MRQAYDVVIIGASLAGCTAAIMFAERGAKVALVERNPEPTSYKKICTHFIQASASSIIDNIGLGKLIEEAGGLKNYGEFWTRWGWIREECHTRRYGYNIRREILDPLLRKLAMSTPGVDTLLGYSARELLGDATRTTGVRVESTKAKGDSATISAKLVVGADGRSSRIARLAGLASSVTRNHRFSYFTYYRDTPLRSNGASQLWLLDPDVAYACPNDNQVTMVAVSMTNDKLDAWKSDLDRSFVELFTRLASGPRLDCGKRIAPFYGAFGVHHIRRKATRPGLALVGDAALAADNLWGVGCGWAFQSAGWLVDYTYPHLTEPVALDRALFRYERHHREMLGWHERLISQYASGRRFNVLEKLMLSAAARSSRHAALLTRYADRSATVGEFLSPKEVASATMTNIRHWVGSRAMVSADLA